MYKYSKRSQSKFMSVPELCFLFIYFSIQPSAKAMVIKKIQSKGNEYTERILRDISELSHQALLALHESDSADKSQLYINLLQQQQQTNLSLNISSFSELSFRQPNSARPAD